MTLTELMQHAETLDPFEPPNIDGMTDDPADLRALCFVFDRLSMYADSRARAIELRRQGDIDAATCHELRMDTLYKSLPTWARW